METIKDLRVNLESKILSSKNIVIVPHNRIDFDALASAIGISLIADKLERKSLIIIDDPIYELDSSIKNVIDDASKQFNIVNKEKYIKNMSDNDLFILTDVNKYEMICLEKELKTVNKDNIFIIDHHNEGSSTVECNHKYISKDVSSASELVARLLYAFKIKYSSEVANYLLAGIELDTNKKTNNVTSNTYKIIAKLMENGASNSIIDNWFLEDFESDKRVFELVSKAIISKYSYAIVMAEETSKYTREELAKVSDQLLRYGVDAAFAIGNIEDNLISISARSKEKIDVGEIMKNLGGGGSRCSAATKISNESIEEVGKKLVKLINPPYITK